MSDDKPARPSLQLLIDRDLARQFRGVCMTNGTTASAVVTGWIVAYLREHGVTPATDGKPPPKRRTPRPKGRH